MKGPLGTPIVQQSDTTCLDISSLSIKETEIENFELETLVTASPHQIESSDASNHKHQFHPIFGFHHSTILFALTTVLLFSDQNILAPNLTAAASEFHFTNEERDQKLGGNLAFAFFVLGAPASLLFGYLGDVDFDITVITCQSGRTGRKKQRVTLLALVVLLGQSASIATYISTTYQQFFICRTLTGLSVGGALPLMYSMLGDWYAAKDRPVVAAMVGVGTGVGIAMGQTVAGILGPRYGWRLPYVVLAIPGMVCAVLLWWLVDDPVRGGNEQVGLNRIDGPENDQKRSSARVDENDVSTTSLTTRDKLSSTVNPKCTPAHSLPKQSALLSTLALFQRPAFVLVVLQGGPGCIPWGIVSTFLNDYLAQDRGMTVEKATFVIMCFGVGCFLGMSIGGVGGRRLYQIHHSYPCLLCGVSVAAGCIPLWYLLNRVDNETPFLPLVLSAVVAGVGPSVAGPIVKSTLQNVTPPQSRGRAFALMVMLDDVGKGLGPVFVAWLIGRYGGERQDAFNTGLWGWMVCGMANALASWFVVKDEIRTQREVTLVVERSLVQMEGSGKEINKQCS